MSKAGEKKARVWASQVPEFHDVLETAVDEWLQSLGCGSWGSSHDLVGERGRANARGLIMDAIEGVAAWLVEPDEGFKKRNAALAQVIEEVKERYAQ